MWNFNKVGRVVAETEVQRGLVVRLTKVWPWKRKELSSGFRYLVTATNPQGIEVYNHTHSHKVLFPYIVRKYREDFQAIQSYQESLDVKAFSLGIAIEEYLTKDLPNGIHLVMVPMNRKVSEAFWKEKADDVCTNHEDPRLDGYVANVSSYEGDLTELVEESRLRYPGRYFLITVKDDYVQSRDDLL